MSQKANAPGNKILPIRPWFNGSNSLLPISSIFAGTLSGFWVNGILGVKPVRANPTTQFTSCLNQTIEAPADREILRAADGCSSDPGNRAVGAGADRTALRTTSQQNPPFFREQDKENFYLFTSSPLHPFTLDRPPVGNEQRLLSPPHKPAVASRDDERERIATPHPLVLAQYSLTTSTATLKTEDTGIREQGSTETSPRLRVPASPRLLSSPHPLTPSLPHPLTLSQSHAGDPEKSTLQNTKPSASQVLGTPEIRLQGVVLNQGNTSARARASAIYPISPYVLFGATVDLTTGNDFSDSRQTGLSLNELYVAASPKNLPGVRLVAGLMDLTSYFDRNSFAKDGATHFFNPVFQTNPALSATGISSRPGFLANWAITDNLEVKATTFSSSRSPGDLALNAFAGEVGFRFGNAIIRGTYVSDRDTGQRDGFREIFQIPRGGDRFGFRRGDREHAYGLNGEYFIPKLKLGLFGRYGRYDNLAINRGGDTYSLGLNFLDLFAPADRLGLAYGRGLSNDDLRRQSGSKVPDVLELFYDFRLLPYLRAGLTFQERNQFSDTILGFRIKTEFDVSPIRRLFR